MIKKIETEQKNIMVEWRKQAIPLAQQTKTNFYWHLLNSLFPFIFYVVLFAKTGKIEEKSERKEVAEIVVFTKMVLFLHLFHFRVSSPPSYFLRVYFCSVLSFPPKLSIVVSCFRLCLCFSFSFLFLLSLLSSLELLDSATYRLLPHAIFSLRSTPLFWLNLLKDNTIIGIRCMKLYCYYSAM